MMQRLAHLLHLAADEPQAITVALAIRLLLWLSSDVERGQDLPVWSCDRQVAGVDPPVLEVSAKFVALGPAARPGDVVRSFCNVHDGRHDQFTG